MGHFPLVSPSFKSLIWIGLILHCGTNDLRSSKSDVDVSTEIITLAKSIETHGIDAIISGLIARGDSHEDKRRETNLILQDMCNEEHISFIDHENIKADLNRSQLHLNSYGDEMLKKSGKCFSKMTQRCQH